MGLQQFERRLERLVEGVFARAFRSQLRPVELGRRLTREMDQSHTVGVRGSLVAPNAFHIALSPTDRDAFSSFEDALVRELAEAAREHARDERYRFLGPVEVDLVTDDSLTTGRFLVASEVRAAPGGGPTGSLLLSDGTRIPVGDDPVAIGRLPECEITLSDPNVSRRHAEVRRQDDDIVVVDLGSTNGTRVNGAGITTHSLVDGDEIVVGTTSIRFEAS
jgi:hypothetical protein